MRPKPLSGRQKARSRALDLKESNLRIVAQRVGGRLVLAREIPVGGKFYMGGREHSVLGHHRGLTEYESSWGGPRT